jgi:hypothetical protein
VGFTSDSWETELTCPIVTSRFGSFDESFLSAGLAGTEVGDRFPSDSSETEVFGVTPASPGEGLAGTEIGDSEGTDEGTCEISVKRSITELLLWRTDPLYCSGAITFGRASADRRSRAAGIGRATQTLNPLWAGPLGTIAVLLTADDIDESVDEEYSGVSAQLFAGLRTKTICISSSEIKNSIHLEFQRNFDMTLLNLKSE